MSIYKILLNILDKIRDESPSNSRKYRPKTDNLEEIINARSKAFIHLYLKAKFGLLDFKERDMFITDGSNDGGVDGYYFDEDNKIGYFIQAKFRATEKNFEKKYISIEDISLKMEINRILQGETTQENGNKFNGKILGIIRKMKSLKDIGRYQYKVIILANLSPSISNNKLKRLVGGLTTEVFNYKKCYTELVFPVIKGTLFAANELNLSINLTDKNSCPNIDYDIKTESGECKTRILFIPTLEVGKIMYKYKNSILKHNPRSFLTLKEGSINSEIRNSITEKSTNEFAIFNNGLTIICDDAKFNDKTGQKDRAKLWLKNPQIINGGQTAYTLSIIYEEFLESGIENHNPFEQKEVLAKIISLKNIADCKKEEFIELISTASNKQNPIDFADRSSNQPHIIKAQKTFFENYTIFLERKRGEFYDGLNQDYITKDQLINRSTFLKIAYSCEGYPVPPRKQRKLFSSESFEKILGEKSNFTKYFFGTLCYNFLHIKKNMKGIGNAADLGKFALVSVAGQEFNKKMKIEEMDMIALKIVQSLLEKWEEFEVYAADQYHNKEFFKYKYFYRTNNFKLTENYQGYYLSSNLAIDLNDFFFNGALFLEEEEENKRKHLKKQLSKYLNKKGINIDLIKKVRQKLPSRKTALTPFDKKNISDSLNIKNNMFEEIIMFIFDRETGYYANRIVNGEMEISR